MNKLLLIDGSNLIFRAYFASEKQNVKTLDGRPGGAIRTLVSMINKIISEERPTHMFIALDTKAPTFRHHSYEDYKAGRSKTPEDLNVQFPMAMELYDAMGIKHYGVDGYEADDLIATYAIEAQKQGFKVKIVSGDKDLLQLVDDEIEVLTPKMGFSKEVNYTPEVFIEKYEFGPERFIEYKALVGDKSDNIIGVEKIGDKTARKLINQYPSYVEMVEAAKNGEVKGKVGENLAASLEQIEMNIKLVTLLKETPLEIEIEDLVQEHFASQRLVDYLNDLGFSKHANDFASLLDETPIAKEVCEFQVIEQFDPALHTDTKTAVYTQTLTDNYFQSECLGFAVSSPKGTFYIRNHSEQLETWLKSDAIKITYDYKRLCSIVGYQVNNVIFDSYLAASLIDVTLNKMPMDHVMGRFGATGIETFEAIYKIKSNPQMPELEVLSQDIATKAHALYETFPSVASSIESNNLTEVMYEIELPLSPVLSQIELNGITIDVNNVNSLKQKYSEIVDGYAKKISEYTAINVASPMQLSEYLFTERELPTKGLKKTTRGISTDVTNLSKLLDNIDSESDDAKLINLILEQRIYTKLLSTYVVGIEKHIDENAQIKPIYNQLLSETGRLSTREPSIQNIPIRSEEGQVIRSLFSCKPGYKLVAIDYSQVELRMMAHISQDQKLIEAFMQDADIHASTAETIFGTSADGNRSKAKAINFGIIYGMSKYGLAKQVGISNAEAELFIDKYFENYPAIKTYIETTIASATETGYVKTIFNRMREISDIRSSNHMKREHAKNAAINTPVQGSAADLIKIAMIKVAKHIENTDTKMIMQIHDELVFEIKETELNSEIEAICTIMQEATKLSVPLKVDYGVGDNWLEAK
ncbi:DNA polymerase I [Mollicutes bacterium LVI A0039]|nr:DNA polymerase I [Mollicutes bacterium LVI A0039]